MRRNIFITLQSFAEYSDVPLLLLKNAGVSIRLNTRKHRLNQSEIIELGEDSDGIIAGVEPYDKMVFNKLLRLKCISRCGVGIDGIDLKEAERRGIAILNTPDVVVQPVAEMTIAMIFNLLRLLTYHTNLLKSGEWRKRAGHLLKGRKVGVVGLGRIGKRVAEILGSLNAYVYGCDLKVDSEWLAGNNIKILSISELLCEVDVLCLHVSASTDNTFFLGKKEMAQLKKGAIIINTSRGQILDEGALYESLVSGHLGGAALDVFGEEPYSGQLVELDNVVLTPHISTLTKESRIEMETQAVENILEYFDVPYECPPLLNMNQK